VDEPNVWGLENLGVGRPEWTLDWYGPYSAAEQTNPVGAASGWAKVVRGGGLDFRKNKLGGVYPAEAPYFERAANRASMAPSFASPGGNIGFRVVQAPMPRSAPTAPWHYFFETAVKQVADHAGDGPDPTKPWMRMHEMFPDIGDRSMPDVGWKIGLARGLGIAYHNSAIQEMPNGDMLAAYYNSPKLEDDPDQTLLVLRRRAGSEMWDMPEPWPYFADATNAAPVIWNDRGKVWFFWGQTRLIGAWPFAFTTSTDNGVTWSAVEFPKFTAPIGRYVPQPINSVVRTSDGTILLPTDSTGRDATGNGSISAVWGSHDNGKTWYDTGGRTGGRHTTIVMSKDGNILGFGGKNSNIDGRMPLAISKDGGKTWQKQKTPFDPLGSGERPSVIRLKSGRLFFVADFNPKNEKHVHKDGAYVALSDDDGKTWTMKRLPGKILTVGYTTATQGVDGVIHVVTSKNKPNYEIELNETWVMDESAGVSAAPTAIHDVEKHVERYADGRVRATWSSGWADDGEVLLEGPEEFFYSDGRPMWRVQFHLGNATGHETYLREDGSKIWEKDHGVDGWAWTMYDAAGKQTAWSKWKGKQLVSSSVPDVPVDGEK
jgi:predicted neuraminidase